MSKEEGQGTKKWVKGVVIIAIIVAIVALWLISVKMYFTPTHMVETKISAKEQQYIFDFLEIESDRAMIEKVEYSHAREHVFFVYVVGLTEKDLEDKYTPDYYGDYVKNTTEFPNIIGYQFMEENGKKMVKFYLCSFDEELYEIVE